MAGMAAVDRLTTLQSSRSSGLPALRFALLLAAALSVSMAYGVTLPLLPELLERLAPGSAPADVARHTGWLTGAYTAALFVFSPAWGALSDRIDRRAVIAAGLVGSGLALLMLDRVSSLAGLYAARLAAGALSAAVLPAVFAYVVEVSEPSARRKQFAWVATGTALGFLLGPLAGIALSGMAGRGNSAMWIAGWMPDSPLVIVAAIGLLSAVATLGMPRSTPAATLDRIAAASGGEARIRTTLLMTALVVFGITIAEVGLTLLGRGSLSLGALGVAAYFALCSVVMVAVQLWGYPPLERLLGEARLVAAAFIGMAVGLALLAWPVAVWAPAIAFVLAGSGVGILIPALAVRISAAAGARPGWALGRQAAAANLGQALGAAATGVLYAAAAQAPFLVGAVVLGAGALLAARSDPVGVTEPI